MDISLSNHVAGRRLGINIILTLTLLTVCVGSLSTRAAAATLTNCAGKPSKHIGESVPFLSTAGTLFGKAEWRYGTSGPCKGYKWVVVHVTRPFNTATSPDNGLWVKVSRSSNSNDQITKYWDVQRVTAGPWHSYAMYGYHRSLEANSYCLTRSGRYLVTLGQFGFPD